MIKIIRINHFGFVAPEIEDIRNHQIQAFPTPTPSNARCPLNRILASM